MAESKAQGSDQVYGQVKRTYSDNVCEPCKVDNIIRPATGWCEECDEKLCDNCHTAHRKFKLTNNHQFWSLGEMTARKQRPRVSNKCKKHEGELLKYFCEDHTMLACGQCFVATHRRCTDVICISENRTTESHEFKALETLLEKLCSRLHVIQEAADRNKDFSAKQHDKAIGDIEDVGQKLKMMIDNLVQEQVDKVKRAREKDMRNMADVEKTCTDIADKVNTNREMLAVEKKDNNQLFITMKHVQHEMKMAESELEIAEQRSKVTENVFELNPHLAAVLKVTELGRLRETRNVELEKATDELEVEIRRFQFLRSIPWPPFFPVAELSRRTVSIQVSTSQNVRLCSVLIGGFYVMRRASTVKLAIMKGRQDLLRCCNKYSHETRDVVELQVVSEGNVRGVNLLAGHDYDICVTTNCPWRVCGHNGQAEVTMDGVKFTFRKSQHSLYQTDDVEQGTIIGFKFTRSEIGQTTVGMMNL